MLIALTRERGRNERLRQLVGTRADVVELPLTSTVFRPTSDVAYEITSLSHFGGFRSLVVTSVRCEPYVALGKAALVEPSNTFSTGPRTSAMLRRQGLAVAGESSDTAVGLLGVISEGPVLILGAVRGRAELSEGLARRNILSTRVECYETVPMPPSGVGERQMRAADVVFIGAPSSWSVARELVNSQAWVLVPGRTTFDAVHRDHERVLLGWGKDFEDAWRVLSAPNVP